MKDPVITIDCDYMAPRFAAAFLRTTPSGDAAFIENNTTHAVPKLVQALKSNGLKPENVKYLIITHVHLDHAGGTSALLKKCPRATVLAHPRAARHLIDPSKLIVGARSVYGAERFAELYGEIEPLAAERVREMHDGDSVQLGGSRLNFIHTRGHAKHHLIVHDPDADTVFTGDTFGMVYPDLQRAGPFIFPSTSPTDFEPDEALRSIDRVVGLNTSRAHVTHFGEVTDLRCAAAQLREHIEFARSRVEKYRGDSRPFAQLAKTIESELRVELDRALRAVGLEPTAQDWKTLSLDLEINAQGLAWVAQKQEAASKT